jgi:hypothetical protein
MLEKASTVFTGVLKMSSRIREYASSTSLYVTEDDTLSGIVVSLHGATHGAIQDLSEDRLENAEICFFKTSPPVSKFGKIRQIWYMSQFA